MKIKQLSIFLENKTGRINVATKVLADASINMSAFSLSEGNEFGIMRLIVSNVEKAAEILRENRFKVNISEVICLKIEDEPGSLTRALDALTKDDIFIEYMYAFTHGHYAYVVIRPTKMDEAIDSLNRNNIGLLNSEEITKL